MPIIVQIDQWSIKKTPTMAMSQPIQPCAVVLESIFTGSFSLPTRIAFLIDFSFVDVLFMKYRHLCLT